MKYLAEFHDAVISRVETSIATVDLKVDHMSVFCEVGAPTCDVFSAKGVLRILGSPEGSLAPDGGEILDVEGIPNVVELAPVESLLRRQFPIALVTFHLADGSTWAIRGTQATLELRLEGPRLEEWDGPLEDEGSEGVLWLPR